jgi:hypothetical protein
LLKVKVGEVALDPGHQVDLDNLWLSVGFLQCWVGKPAVGGQAVVVTVSQRVHTALGEQLQQSDGLRQSDL